MPIAAIVRRPTSAPHLVAEAFATALAVIAVVWAGRLLWLIEQPWHPLARGREVPWLTGTALKGSGSPEPVFFVSRPAILAPCPDRPEPDPMARIIRPDVEAAMTLALTRSIGRFIEDLAFDQIPAAAVAIVATGFTDCIACGIAGLDEPVVRIILDALPTRKRYAARRHSSPMPPAPPPRTPRSSMPSPAMCSTTTIVALFGHPSVVMVPAILAEGEAVGVTGRDAVCAYLAGYEVWSDLIGRDRHLHHTKGWHPTGIFGTLAAAAAGAKLRQLDAARASHAIGLAAAMAAGLTANFGAMAKAFQAGRAAQNGLLAARLAAAGMTAAPDVLEHTPGLLQALSPHGEVDLDREPTFGHDWTILRFGLNLKRYPVVYYCQRTLDALFTLLAEHPLRPSRFQRIHVLVSPTEALILKQHRPQTALEAKFSMEFALAAAIVAGRVGLSELTDGFVQRPEVQALFRRVHLADHRRHRPRHAHSLPLHAGHGRS